jgi:glyoxylase-like metal-dependent hydrolase (beta-lactamase superfamily II)
MRQLADGVWQLAGLLPDIINTYLIRTATGDVLIDAGTRWDTGRILRELRGAALTMVALTHVHPDHQGAAAEVCQRFGVPLACHEADVDVMEGRQPMEPNTPVVRLFSRLWSGASHPVSIRWKDGDTFDEWQVIHTPGHTLGHVIYFRPRDGVAIIGDLIRNASVRHGIGRVSETPHFFSVDPMLNRRSMRKLLDCRPKRICFGHGPMLADIGPIERLVEGLGQ